MKLVGRNLIQILILVLLIIFLVVFLTTSIDKKQVESKSRFHYSSNDSHCPLAIFEDEEVIYEKAEDTCKRETVDWLIVRNNVVIFNKLVIKKVGDINCIYKTINWKTDFESTLSHTWTPLFNNTYLGNDVLLVQCKGNNMFRYYEQYLFGFHRKSSISDIKTPTHDILILGIDSISRLAWKRLLKDSYHYLETAMNDTSVIFQKMNVLGDGTTVNVMGLLAGEFEMDVYESRRNFPNAKSVDNYPWIWKTLKVRDYITYYDEDDVPYGTFQYRLLGFQSPPTDFYSRTWRMISDIRKHSSLCMNHRNIFQDQLHNVKGFFNNNKSPKFAHVWSTQFSHNVNEEVVPLDKSLLKFLKLVNNPDGIFKNTILILMSDHGHRFNSRLHLQGKYEERLPFFAINLPRNFKRKRPEILANLKTNENKLITTMDVYESLQDIVSNFTRKEKSVDYKMSLFQPNIPYRPCKQMKIATHWCSCLQWSEISTDQPAALEAAKKIVVTINSITDEYRTKCHLLTLDKVLRASKVAPSSDVLRFHDSDGHGRVPNMLDNTEVDGIYYQITLRTKPGDAIFETTIGARKTKSQTEYTIDISTIDRSNRYQDWIWCIDSSMKDVRKYCLCR